MKSSAKRTLLGSVLAIVGAGLVAAGLVLRWSIPSSPHDLTPSVRQARERIERALASLAREIEPKVAQAASTPELIAALAMHADRTTIQDLLETEDWWAPFRKHFPLSGVLGSDGPLGLLVPGSDSDIDAAGWLRSMGGRALYSTTVPGHGRAFLVAMAKVAKREGEGPATVLGSLLDHAALLRVSDATGDCVGLGDETGLIESAGPGQPARVLAALAEGKHDGAVTLEDGRIGTAWTIGGGLRILAAFRSAPVASTAPSRGSTVLISVGIALVLGCLFLVLFRGPAHATLPPRRSGALQETTARSPEATSASRKTDSGPTWQARGSAALALKPNQNERVPTRQLDANDAPASRNQMGRYDLIERIGEGGMAEIFFAVAHGAEDFVRYFVVKRIHRHLAKNRAAVDQFIDEAKLQARLVHSNIVPVFDFGKAGDEYFLALEYIHGKDVHQVVRTHVAHFGRALDLATASYILHEVLVALDFAHAQTEKDGTPMEVVHRDVAPGNVLVSYQGEVKLTDFGIAKAEKRVSRTEVGMVKGNASFMSPEQARGGTVDHRSDLFSAGVLLYHCLTAQPFYPGDTPMANLLNAADGRMTGPLAVIGDLPLPAAQILRRALAVDPDQRYQTATAFELDLAPHMGTRAELGQLMDILFPTEQRRDLR